MMPGAETAKDFFRFVLHGLRRGREDLLPCGPGHGPHRESSQLLNELARLTGGLPSAARRRRLGVAEVTPGCRVASRSDLAGGGNRGHSVQSCPEAERPHLGNPATGLSSAGPKYAPPHPDFANNLEANDAPRRNYRVELIDYSGELINPYLKEDELTRLVQAHEQHGRPDRPGRRAEDRPGFCQARRDPPEAPRCVRVDQEGQVGGRRLLPRRAGLQQNGIDAPSGRSTILPRRRARSASSSPPSPSLRTVALRTDLESAVGRENFSEFVASASLAATRSSRSGLPKAKRSIRSGPCLTASGSASYRARRSVQCCWPSGAKTSCWIRLKGWSRRSRLKHPLHFTRDDGPHVAIVRRIDHLKALAKDSPTVQCRLDGLCSRTINALMNRLEDTVKAFESRRSWNFSKKGRQLHEEIIRRIEYLEVLAKESPTVLSRINGLQDRVKDAIHSRTRRRLSAAVIAALLMFVSGMNAWNYHKDTRALSEIADLPESVTPATPFEMPTTSEDRERLQVYRTTRQQIGDRLATAQVCYAHYRPFSWTKIGSHISSYFG